MKLNLRPYQEIQNEVITQSVRRGHKRLISCMATGSGKSPQIIDITRRAYEKGNRTLILLPRRSLVLQLAASFKQYGFGCGVVMAGINDIPHPKINIASVDTYMHRLSRGRMKHIESDLLIIDEMHLQATEKKFELFDKYEYVIGYSATPVSLSGRPLGYFYSKIVETIKMQQLIDQGWLTPLRYFSEDVDLHGVSVDSTGEWVMKEAEQAVNKPKLVGDIVENWEAIARDRPTVVFACSQSHARFIQHSFQRRGYNFAYLDCETKDDERAAVFQGISDGSIMGIVNHSIVGIGVDLPKLSCAVLARPTRKIHTFLQLVGRVTRLYECKSDSIVIDHAGIISELGLPTYPFKWTLDGKSVEEETKKEKSESELPNDFVCQNCKAVFMLTNVCPFCGFKIVQRGKPVPTRKANLVEVTGHEETEWYAQLLGYCVKKGKPASYGLWIFKEKFGHYPKNQNGVHPVSPGESVVKYIISRNIAFAKRTSSRVNSR